jgi:hypothetical protein
MMNGVINKGKSLMEKPFHVGMEREHLSNYQSVISHIVPVTVPVV